MNINFQVMIRQLTGSKYFSILLFLFTLAIYTSNISGVSIYILDEAKNAGCAREMLERGDLTVPTFNEVLRTDKPPLHYFFMMISYSLFGVNAFAARFFSAVFGALTILISYLFVKKFSDQKTALWSVFVLLSSIHLSIQFHLSVPDPYLIFFFTAALFSFYAAIQTQELKYLLFLYLSIGLGALSKGPVAIGLPGLIFLLFLIFSKRFKWTEIKKLRPFSGAILVLAVSLPWYILVGLKTDWEWTSGFFLKHNIGRFSSEMEGHGGIFLITILFVLIGLFPFSAFIVQAFREAWKNRKNEFILFSFIGGLTIVTFFAFSKTKLPNYTVPAYPFFAILIGSWLSGLSIKKMKLSAGLTIMLALSILIVPGIYFGLKFDPALADVNFISWYFLPFPIGMIIAFLLYKKDHQHIALLTAGASGILAALIFFVFAFPVIDRQNPVAKSFHLIKNKEVRHFEKFNPSYSFYLQKEIPEIKPDEFEDFFNKFPEGVIISTKRKLETIELPDDLEISFSSRDVFETPTTILITRKR